MEKSLKVLKLKRKIDQKQFKYKIKKVITEKVGMSMD